MTKKNTVSPGADERSDSAAAFVAEPEREEGTGGSGPDELAEYLGEGFVSSATGGEDGEDGDDVLHADLDFDALGDLDEGLVLDAGSEDGGMSAPGRDAEMSRSSIRNESASPMVRRRR